MNEKCSFVIFEFRIYAKVSYKIQNREKGLIYTSPYINMQCRIVLCGYFIHCISICAFYFVKYEIYSGIYLYECEQMCVCVAIGLTCNTNILFNYLECTNNFCSNIYKVVHTILQWAKLIQE